MSFPPAADLQASFFQSLEEVVGGLRACAELHSLPEGEAAGGDLHPIHHDRGEFPADPLVFEAPHVFPCAAFVFHRVREILEEVGGDVEHRDAILDFRFHETDSLIAVVSLYSATVAEPRAYRFNVRLHFTGDNSIIAYLLSMSSPSFDGLKTNQKRGIVRLFWSIVPFAFVIVIARLFAYYHDVS